MRVLACLCHINIWKLEPLEGDFLFPLCESWGSNLHHQAYQQIHLPAELLSLSPFIYFFETGFNVAQDSLTLGVQPALALHV